MTTTIDGIYAVRMAGQDGQGFAMFVFHEGTVSGADPLGVTFDGSYASADDRKSFEVKMHVTVPANGTVIQGASAGPSGLNYPVRASLPSDFLDQAFVRVDTPLGNEARLELFS